MSAVTEIKVFETVTGLLVTEDTTPLRIHSYEGAAGPPGPVGPQGPAGFSATPGVITTDFNNYDSDVSGVQSTTSTTFVDINQMDVVITTLSEGPIFVQFSYSALRTGGADRTIAFRITRVDGVNAPENSIGMQSLLDSISDIKNGGVTFRTDVLPAGTYTFRPQWRVIGAGQANLVRGQIFAQAQQGGTALSATTFTVATVPDATTNLGRFIWVTNGNAGAPTPAVSDGSTWRVITMGPGIGA